MLLFQPEISGKFNHWGLAKTWGVHHSLLIRSRNRNKQNPKIQLFDWVSNAMALGFTMFCLSFCSFFAAKEHVVAQNPAIAWLNYCCKLPNPQACTPQVGLSLELRHCPLKPMGLSTKLDKKPTKQGRETFRSLITLV